MDLNEFVGELNTYYLRFLSILDPLILRRDLFEINVCSKNQAHKSVLLLCGSVVELLLYRLLSRRREDAKRHFNDMKQQRGKTI
jgi:hypothetical protein